jgi:hypothetical protein
MAIMAAGSWIIFHRDFGLPNPPLFVFLWIFIYGIAANICYTGGWIAELIVRKLWVREADRFATLTFATGLMFSVVLTIAPALVIGSAALFELVRYWARS